MLESVCTTFWQGNCWLDVASNACFFFFLNLFFFNHFCTLNFSQLFNSSSTFKYIVGLSLKIEIWLCILYTVFLKLRTAIAVLRVCLSAGKKVGRVVIQGEKEMTMQMGEEKFVNGKIVWRGIYALFKNKKYLYMLPVPSLVCPARSQGCVRAGRFGMI